MDKTKKHTIATKLPNGKWFTIAYVEWNGQYGNWKASRKVTPVFKQGLLDFVNGLQDGQYINYSFFEQKEDDNQPAQPAPQQSAYTADMDDEIPFAPMFD